MGKEKLTDTLQSLERQSKELRESVIRGAERIGQDFYNVPKPTQRLLLQEFFDLIKAFTVDEFVDTLSISEQFSGKVRKVLSPKK